MDTVTHAELPLVAQVCLMTADFWGLPTAGGTATAYGLLAGALEDDPNLEVGTCFYLSDQAVPPGTEPHTLCYYPDWS